MSSKKKWWIIYIVIGLVALGLFLLTFMILKGRVSSEVEVINTEELQKELVPDIPGDASSLTVPTPEMDSPVYKSESTEELPEWMFDINKNRVSKVEKIFSKSTEEKTDSFASQIDKNYPIIFKKIKNDLDLVVPSIKQESEYKREVTDKVNALSSEEANAFSKQYLLEIQPGFTEGRNSSSVLDTFNDYIWFDFFSCLYLIGSLNDTVAVYTPYDMDNGVFSNTKELIIVDYKDIYIRSDLVKTVKNLGTINSFTNGFVKGTVIKDYEGYKVLFINKYSIESYI
jgi:hypothetical protein